MEVFFLIQNILWKIHNSPIRCRNIILTFLHSRENSNKRIKIRCFGRKVKSNLRIYHRSDRKLGCRRFRHKTKTPPASRPKSQRPDNTTSTLQSPEPTVNCYRAISWFSSGPPIGPHPTNKNPGNLRPTLIPLSNTSLLKSMLWTLSRSVPLRNNSRTGASSYKIITT